MWTQHPHSGTQTALGVVSRRQNYLQPLIYFFNLQCCVYDHLQSNVMVTAALVQLHMCYIVQYGATKKSF